MSYLEVGVGVNISLGFDSFSILTRVLNPRFCTVFDFWRVGLKLLQRAGRYQAGVFPFSIPCCRRWKVFSEPTLGPYPPRVALAVCLSPSRSAIGQRRWGFHTVQGRVDPGEHRFRSRGVRGVEIRRDLWSGHRVLSSPGGVALRAPDNQRSANGIGVYTSCGVVPTWGTPVFIPRCRSYSRGVGVGFLNRDGALASPECPRSTCLRVPANQRSIRTFGFSHLIPREICRFIRTFGFSIRTCDMITQDRRVDT